MKSQRGSKEPRPSELQEGVWDSSDVVKPPTPMGSLDPSRLCPLASQQEPYWKGRHWLLKGGRWVPLVLHCLLMSPAGPISLAALEKGMTWVGRSLLIPSQPFYLLGGFPLPTFGVPLQV
jgi:hypothetical protein